MKVGRALVILASVLGLSCGHGERTARTEDQNAALGGDMAARVGGQVIPVSLVASVANAQNITAREAVRKLVDDEIAASAARTRGLDQKLPVSWKLVAARARIVSERIHDDAKQRGLPTDEEVKILSEKHWVDVDRPPSIHVIHAIVMRPKDPSLLASARSLAAELHKAVVSASSEDFEEAAKAVTHDPKLDVRVEKLPAFVDDGWVTEGSGRMDEAFTKAAFTLQSPGDTTAIVESSFGFHVIRLLERIPEKRMPFETRRLAFAEEVKTMRAYEAVSARLKALRDTIPVSVSPAAEQQMRAVKAVSESAPGSATTP
jgi:peptidyl-prolyl cis-trans isomerase C